MDARKQLNEAELEEIFERSSGPGGQNVNKTSTKVTLRHLPTGISVTIQDSRSQSQNRVIARERLMAAIALHKERERQAKIAAREKDRRRHSPRPAGVKRSFVAGKRHAARLRTQRLARDTD